jgi:hypothetical protein
MELDQRLYHYGKNFILTHETHRYKDKLIYFLWYFAKYYYKALLSIPEKNTAQKKIISSSYFNLNSKLEEIGYSVFSPPYMISTNRVLLSGELNYRTYELLKLLKFSNFNTLIDKMTFKAIEQYIDLFAKVSRNKNINSVIVSNDETPISKIAIETFRRLSRPSFVFLHGLPGLYNDQDNNRADFLIVWGEKIKENFVAAGIDKNKIFVSGHPSYTNKYVVNNTRFSFDNILVLTKTIGGSQHSDDVRLADRGNNIFYLYSIQSALIKLGVKHVRFRPHPSENSFWYLNYIDTNFYKLDSASLSSSLSNSSLVIGPSSSIFIDSYFHNVNYLVYEPIFDGLSLSGLPSAPPFNGSDKHIPVASNDDELYYLLKNKICNEVSFINDYIQHPFNLDFMKKLV